MSQTSDDAFDDAPADDDLAALGWVLDDDRGSLPYALIHGEALVACAAWALGEAGVMLLDASITWESIREAGEPLVLHDALCPMTPVDFIAGCLRRAVVDDVVVVGTRPVTDTIKLLGAGLVGDTVDREGLTSVVSPVVIPSSVVAELVDAPGSDLIELVADLARSHRVVLVEAPASARRVHSPDDLPLLEALTAG